MTEQERPQIMADFETLGTDPGCKVISLGIVGFSRTKGIYFEREYFFNLESQYQRTMDVSTVVWWINQADEAKRKTFRKEKTISLSRFCAELASDVLGQTELAFGISKEEAMKSVLIHGNGSDFDCSILANIYKGEGVLPFWKYYNHRCFRTFDALTGAKKLHPFKGVKHSALDDAKYQAECVLKAWEAGRGVW